MKESILRILDANLNRSREGLRVCEEISRFILNSRTLTGELKSIRHRISGIVKRLPERHKLIFYSRDAKGDIGRKCRMESAKDRRDCADILIANMERVKESLRVLEEFFKLSDRSVSAKFEAMRFEIYDFEKKALKKIIYLRGLK